MVQWALMTCTQGDPLDHFRPNAVQVHMVLEDPILQVLEVAVVVMEELMETMEAAVEDTVVLRPPEDMGKWFYYKQLLVVFKK